MSFRLPNFLNSAHLNALRFEMGAPLSASFKVQSRYIPIELPVVERLRADGIDVGFEDIKVLDDGTLGYRGYRVLLYIRDVNNVGDRQTLPKYHISYCHALDRMRRQRRFERYVVANRDDGMFLVNLMHESERSRVLPLNVCQYCLAQLAWNGFGSELSRQERMEYVRAFSLTEFFTRYPRDLISVAAKYTSDTAPLNEYTEDWPDVSERTKREVGYRCSSCSLQLKLRFSRFLHVHHKNGLKYDNSPTNLEVLCIGCHAEEPLHAHMKAMPEYLEFIELYPSK